MKYKFAAADMDGTLLNDSNEITPHTVKIIRQAVDKGLIFSICTGRPIQGVSRYQKQLGIQGPVITYNGAMILDSATEKNPLRQELASDDAPQKSWKQASAMTLPCASGLITNYTETS